MKLRCIRELLPSSGFVTSGGVSKSVDDLMTMGSFEFGCELTHFMCDQKKFWENPIYEGLRRGKAHGKVRTMGGDLQIKYWYEMMTFKGMPDDFAPSAADAAADDFFSPGPPTVFDARLRTARK